MLQIDADQIAGSKVQTARRGLELDDAIDPPRMLRGSNAQQQRHVIASAEAADVKVFLVDGGDVVGRNVVVVLSSPTAPRLSAGSTSVFGLSSRSCWPEVLALRRQVGQLERPLVDVLVGKHRRRSQHHSLAVVIQAAQAWRQTGRFGRKSDKGRKVQFRSGSP